MRGFPTAPVTRAVVDLCRHTSDLRTVRAIVSEVVQRGRTTVPALTIELGHGPRGQRALLGRVLAEVSLGARSAPEAEAAALFRRSGLAGFTQDALVLNELGRSIARVDFLWVALRVVVEIDGREWHLSPAHWEQTMRRHAALAAAGYAILHFSPQQLRSRPGEVIDRIRMTLRRRLDLSGMDGGLGRPGPV